jgi:ComF family protein
METLMAEDALCGACLANLPPYARVHVPLAYGAATRSIVMRLKYGRKTGFARLMARLMLRKLREDASGNHLEAPPLFIPVPLHRWRIWHRGFNQSAEVAGHLARATGWPLLVDGLHRHKRTPPLRGLGRRDRARTVRGAFTVRESSRDQLAGRRVLLVDDVFTTGATAAACSRALLLAGASSVEVVAFARVIDRPDPADNLLGMIDSRVPSPNIAS